MRDGTPPPPIGGEAIAILGSPHQAGSTLVRSLIWRGYQPYFTGDVAEVKLLIARAVVTGVIILETVPLDVAHRLCRSLRTTHWMTSIVVLRHRGEPMTGSALLDSGADHYAFQPVNLSEILERLRMISRRSRQVTAPPTF